MPTKFTIDAGPDTEWRVLVVVHPNSKQMHKARRKLGNTEGTCGAFCWTKPTIGLIDTDEIAEIHFNRRELPVAFVVHEVYHAFVAYARLIRLKTSSVAAEEWAAESIEHMTGAILWMLKKKGIKTT